MPNVVLKRGFSYDVLPTYPDNTFDMIYIDGDHSYNGCKRDLELCYKKVKSNGWIMGHDYEMNMLKTTNSYDFGVRRAVDEFCLRFGQTIHSKGLDGCVSFAIKLHK